jgi:hypothetical protein
MNFTTPSSALPLKMHAALVRLFSLFLVPTVLFPVPPHLVSITLKLPWYVDHVVRVQSSDLHLSLPHSYSFSIRVRPLHGAVRLLGIPFS